MKPGIISDSITLHFANLGVRDNMDLMRCSIFAMDIERLSTEDNLNKESIKQLSSYNGVVNNIISMTDEFLDEIIEKADFLKNMEDRMKGE